MNKIIVAIGGGNTAKLETLAIDQKIIELTRKKKPKLLFIPTASYDSVPYAEMIQKIYGDKLGCSVEPLYLLKKNPDLKKAKQKIEEADIIYVGGGNTLKMMRRWRHLGVDKLLIKAYNSGTVMCGVSAGAICWFDYGHSDSMSFYNEEDWNYIRVKGLGLLEGTFCPHFNGETKGIKREDSFMTMMQKVGGKGIAVDDHAALLVINGEESALLSKESATVKIFRKGVWLKI